MAKLIQRFVLVTTLMGALAAPEPVLADCVGERRACRQSALLEYNDCNGGCSSVVCWYICEWGYDMDRAACWLEFIGCANPL